MTATTPCLRRRNQFAVVSCQLSVVRTRRSTTDHWPLTTGHLLALAGLCFALPVLPARASDASQNIYAGQAIVTGIDQRDRPRGLRLCLGQVLVNVSGDPNILFRPGAAAILAQAAGMVVSLNYFDRMSGLPHHDDQGTRDRPFTLTANFDPAKVAAALAEIGETPRQGPRPSVFLAVHVHGPAGDFTLQNGPAAGYDMPELMRASIDDAAGQYKLRVRLPVSASDTPAAGLLLVEGNLTWSDADFGWIAAWGAGGVHWGEHGVSFDDAFRAALAGALGIASGHAPPRG